MSIIGGWILFGWLVTVLENDGWQDDKKEVLGNRIGARYPEINFGSYQSKPDFLISNAVSYWPEQEFWLSSGWWVSWPIRGWWGTIMEMVSDHPGDGGWPSWGYYVPILGVRGDRPGDDGWPSKVVCHPRDVGSPILMVGPSWRRMVTIMGIVGDNLGICWWQSIICLMTIFGMVEIILGMVSDPSG